MKARRVVTGHVDGRSVIVSDDDVEPVTLSLAPGSEFCRLWGSDETVTFPDDGSVPPHHTYFPPVGGFRFEIVTLPPGFNVDPIEIPPDIDLVAAAGEAFEKLGMTAQGVPDPDRPGMHVSDSIDMIVILSGELWMAVEDGTEVHLRQGDTIVQNGTQHAWYNRGKAPVEFAVFLVGANRSS